MSTQPPAVIHVDLDGAADIYKSHGWDFTPADDPLFETGLRNILDLFDRNKIQATLFTIASSLDDPRKRKLIEEALGRGHEIASHSMTHAHLIRLNRDEKRREIAGSREKLEGALGVTIGGFRAPGYLIDRESLELLAESGYAYDASAFPTAVHARRLETSLDMLLAPHHPVAGSPLMELPLSDHRPCPVPFSPSYALLAGTRFFRWGAQRASRRGGPFVMLFHLTDVSSPLPPGRQKNWRQTLFTLSMMTARTKMTRCQAMLDVLRGQFEVTTTQTLLDCLRSREVVQDGR